MDQPLGRAVGNALELKEALDTIRGQGPPDFRQHCLVIGAQMLMLTGQYHDEAEAIEKLARLVDTGQALAKFRSWISAQGGDLAYVDDPAKLPTATCVQQVTADRSGYVAGLDAREVGLTSMLLGGGRARKNDAIDHAVGVELHKKVADRVEEGQPLLTIHANDPAKVAGARQRLLAAYQWSDDPVEPPPLIRQVVS
jgi:pyrimidine-nucleoside phosphorylase